MREYGDRTLGKEERISGLALTKRLFKGGESRSTAVFPLRAVYMRTARKAGEPPAKIMVSVPKRCLKRAVKRNRVKRQVREAYRAHKHLLPDTPDKALAIAFIWLDDKLHDSKDVAYRVRRLLEKVAGRQ